MQPERKQNIIPRYPIIFYWALDQAFWLRSNYVDGVKIDPSFFFMHPPNLKRKDGVR